MTLTQRAVRALFWVGIGYLLGGGERWVSGITIFVALAMGLVEVVIQNKAKRRLADAIVEDTGGNGRVGPRRPTTFTVNTPRGARIIDGEWK